MQLLVGACNEVEHEEVCGVCNVVFDVETVGHCFLHGMAETAEEGVEFFILGALEGGPSVADRLFSSERGSAETKVRIKFVPHFNSCTQPIVIVCTTESPDREGGGRFEGLKEQSLKMEEHVVNKIKLTIAALLNIHRKEGGWHRA